MKGIDAKQFNNIVRSFNCDEEINAQIREFIKTAMIPDEDIIRNHCIVAVSDKGKRFFNRQRQTKYFDVVFYVMYYPIGQEFTGEPIFEITYEAAWELSKEDYDSKMAEQLMARSLLCEAMEIINPSCIE